MKPHLQTTSKQPSTVILNGPSTIIFNKFANNASLAEILPTTAKVETTTTKPQLAIDLGKILFTLLFYLKEYTANFYRGLQGLCGEIGVWGFQIYGDCMYTRNPCNIEISTLLFPCKNCRDFDFRGILQGYLTLNVEKSCKKKKNCGYFCKICGDFL